MPLPKSITGYRWLDKDPVIDVFREAMRKSGLSYDDIASKSGVRPGTLRRWDKGDTKKPQHLTLRFAMEACGYREAWLGPDRKAIFANYRRKK